VCIGFYHRQRSPTSANNRQRVSSLTGIDINRPITAPMIIDNDQARTRTNRIKSAAPPIRSVKGRTPSIPLRAACTIDASENFDNLNSTSFLHLTDGLKSSVLRDEHNFVHHLCSNTNENMIDVLNTSRDSFLDASNPIATAMATADDTDDDEENSKVRTMAEQARQRP
jgi:hypothetical protein